MKYLTSILAMLYLTFSIGVSVSSHYCMGLLKDVSFGMEADRCVCADSEMFGDCCEDVHQVFQVDEDQQGGFFSFAFLQTVLPAPSFSPQLEVSREELKEEPFSTDLPPPKICESRTFIQSLIFYA